MSLTMVFFCLTSDVSPEFSTWIAAAVNTVTAGGQADLSPQRLVTLVLNSSPLPPALEGQHSSAISSELLELGQGHGLRSEDGVRATCKLFCCLIGLQMELSR